MSDVDLKHLAELASLTLSESEAARLAGDLERIVAYVGELASVDTSGVEPTAIVGARGTNVLRKDDLAASLPREEVLSQAPRANVDGFLVPTFVES